MTSRENYEELRSELEIQQLVRARCIRIAEDWGTARGVDVAELLFRLRTAAYDPGARVLRTGDQERPSSPGGPPPHACDWGAEGYCVICGASHEVVT